MEAVQHVGVHLRVLGEVLSHILPQHDPQVAVLLLLHRLHLQGGAVAGQMQVGALAGAHLNAVFQHQLLGQQAVLHIGGKQVGQVLLLKAAQNLIVAVDVIAEQVLLLLAEFPRIGKLHAALRLYLLLLGGGLLHRALHRKVLGLLCLRLGLGLCGLSCLLIGGAAGQHPRLQHENGRQQCRFLYHI